MKEHLRPFPAYIKALSHKVAFLRRVHGVVKLIQIAVGSHEKLRKHVQFYL